MTLGQGTLGADYFDHIYAESPDPWGFTDRWYETRKRAVTTALLPEPRYGSCYEPGCSIGVLTAELATRCDRVLSSDISAAAATIARERTLPLGNVTVGEATLPGGWPTGDFDLVVLSELVYYFSAADAETVATLAVSCAGTLIAVHWRHPVADYPLPGDEAQRIVATAAAGLTHAAHYLDRDFVADVWTRTKLSVADGALV